MTIRDKRAVLTTSRRLYLAGGGLSRLTELAKEVVKVWRRPAASLLRLATLRTFGLLSEGLTCKLHLQFANEPDFRIARQKSWAG